MTSNNPYSAPQSNLLENESSSIVSKIDALDVSEAWKEKFKGIALAGGPKMPNLKALSKADRKKAFSFNVLAFLFGPIYYIIKGMWKKGIVLFVGIVVVLISIGLMLEFFWLDNITKALGYAVGPIFAIRANVDYYKKMVLDDNGWI